ncbi:DUF7471 family protein [Halopelagius longus]|uniref:Uncharacterized protein n=1 Tax=Halopelagius longus TaxID=1236180 RepID=A0A1H1ECR1_9EURY|nr:hypothetical protein [Halopelagius longus]RDI71702.1 hypothetical protein DWB78_08165 [Halopelagius longus]SDQ86542.1 hypothetical protein SAMN05216278_2844 [Halopelagius longus]
MLSPAHAGAHGGYDGPLTAVLLLAGVGSLVVAGLALGALARRRSRSFLLVALALVTLAARTAVAGATMAGMVETSAHHLLEHGLDVVMAGLVIAAVYYARRTERAAGGNQR